MNNASAMQSGMAQELKMNLLGNLDQILLVAIGSFTNVNLLLTLLHAMLSQRLDGLQSYSLPFP